MSAEGMVQVSDGQRVQVSEEGKIQISDGGGRSKCDERGETGPR